MPKTVWGFHIQSVAKIENKKKLKRGCFGDIKNISKKVLQSRKRSLSVEKSGKGIMNFILEALGC